MNEYMKPDYEVMVFEANEYVAAICEWVQGTDLTISCGGSSARVEIGNAASSTEWSVYLTDSQGKPDYGKSGTLWKNTDDSSKVYYGASVPMTGTTHPADPGDAGFETNKETTWVNGEWQAWNSSTNGGNNNWTDDMYGTLNGNGYKWCDCEFTGGGIASAHHHIASIFNHNRS